MTMKLPVKLVYDVLRADPTFKTIRTYMNHIPEAEIKEANLPMIRITELDTYNSMYAGNQPLGLSSQVQVDIWCKDLQQVTQLYMAIDKTMRDAGFIMATSGSDTDPDFNHVPRVYKRFNVHQRLDLK